MRTQPHRFADRPRLKPGIWFILLVIAGCLAMLLWTLTSTAVSPAPTFEAELAHAPAGGIDRVGKYCPECGVVSSTRPIARSAAGGRSGVEVTVRMNNGSNRQFAEAGSANWRVGERMIIIDSATSHGNGVEPAGELPGR